MQVSNIGLLTRERCNGKVMNVNTIETKITAVGVQVKQVIRIIFRIQISRDQGAGSLIVSIWCDF